jgi:molybdopterin converting factor subunit 1
MARVKVLYWAQAKEVAGKREEYYELKEGERVEALIEKILEKHPALGSISKSVRIAVNGEIISNSGNLKEGDVVALLPPFAGG